MNGQLTFKPHLVTLRMGHHASRSGYDRLPAALRSEEICTPGALNWGQRLLVYPARRWLNESGSRWYNRKHLYTELACARRWVPGNRLFHFLYGENSYRYLGALRERDGRNRIVATYHTPEERFRQIVTKPEHIGRLDAAVAVSRVQFGFLRDWLPESRVFFVPHGVDTAFFRPGNRRRGPSDGDTLRCICVGSHLRDYRTFGKVAEICGQRGAAMEFEVVAPESRRDELGSVSNVKWRSNLSDRELLSAYQNADILLLPLRDCTANNTLLEGLAAGLPVVATDLPGVRDYVSSTSAHLVPQDDPGIMADVVMDLADKPQERAAMSAASRSRALELDWSRIADEMRAVYLAVSA